MKKYVGSIVIGLVLIGLLVLGISAGRAYTTPLAPPLSLQGAQATATTAPQAQTVCGESGTMMVMILGSDQREQYWPPGADLTRVMKVDFSNKKITVYAFPRDLWADVKSLNFANPDVKESTIGKTFWEAHKRTQTTYERERLLAGTTASGQMLLDNFGVSSEHYVTIRLEKLPEMIDAIGGIEINVPYELKWTDPQTNVTTTFAPGVQTMSGEQVMIYARAIPDSDWARIQRNNVLLDALRTKLLQPATWAKIPDLFRRYTTDIADQNLRDVIVTDLTPEQIVNFACLLKEVERKDILLDNVKPEWTSPGPDGSLFWDKDKVQARLRELQLIP